MKSLTERGLVLGETLLHRDAVLLALALGKNLAGDVIAAELVGVPPSADTAFRAWLSEVRFEDLDGRMLISTHEDRPNNWGPCH